MAFIVETIAGDRRIQLGNEEFVRQMAIGVNWTKIRIGMRIGVNGTGSSGTGVAFIAGVCQGVTNSFYSQSTTDFLGMGIGSSSYPPGPAYSFTGSPAGNYYASGGGFQNIRRTGSSTVYGGNANYATGLLSATPSIHSQLFLDVTKGSTYTFTLWMATTVAHVQTDNSSGSFLANMENEAAPANTATVGTGAGAAYTGAGLFDSISISWNRFIPTIDISDIAVCRFL